MTSKWDKLRKVASQFNSQIRIKFNTIRGHHTKICILMRQRMLKTQMTSVNKPKKAKKRYHIHNNIGNFDDMLEDKEEGMESLHHL